MKQARPHIGIHFKCCNAYARIFLNAKGDAFAGNCPKCARPVRIKVSESGVKAKFWEVG